MLGLGLAGVLTIATPLQRPAAGPDRVALAVKIAVDKWGEVCGGAAVPIERANMPDDRLARASYSFPGGSEDNAERYFDCRIKMRRGHLEWRKFCTAIVHEYGHLAGWRAKPGEEYLRPDGSPDRFHSREVRSVMYPDFKRAFPACHSAELDLATGGPLVLVLPGGGFQHADPNTMAPWVDDFTKHGMAARAVTYTTGDPVAAIEDVRRIAASQPGPVFCEGISAGGTICAALAATGAVAGAVNVAGPTDLTRWWTPAGLYIRHQLAMSPQAERAASPYWRLNGRQAPQLVMCGVADPLVDYASCDRYASAAFRAQPDTRLVAMANAHAQSSRDRGVAREWIAARWPSSP